MFNERKLTGTSHGFVKAYSNNWLTHLGAVYKYESPKDVLRKPNHQHRKIALYSILAMAFVAFFTLFMIVHEADRKSRQQLVIEASFGNETAIEPSAGGYNTVLTTPLSSPTTGNGSSEEPEQDGSTASMKRTRRLRYHGGVDVGREQLVLLPARFLRPPAQTSPWSSWEEKPHDSGVVMDPEAERRLGTDRLEPKPFQIVPKGGGPTPVGFQQQSRANRSINAPDDPEWTTANVEEIVRQLTLAKRQQQQQQHQQQFLYFNYPLQPAEFNHPVHANHRVKFSGIYRHPRKNGDVTTLFGAASQRPREVHVQAPQLINQQLQPDRLYNFKPANPSEVNLLATEQFRFAPAQPAPGGDVWPSRGMPFSVMLNLEPMGGQGHKGAPVHQQRFRKPLRNPYRTASYRQPPSWGEQTFAQLTPYQSARVVRPDRGGHQPFRNAFGHAGSDEYEGENYFRREARVPPRIPPFSAPFIGPGRLMVHFNIYPRQSTVAERKSGQEQTTISAETTSVELNTGEQLAKDQPTTDASHAPISLHAPPVSKEVFSTASPTVEVIKSIEIPTQINFDHVPLGRNPPPQLPSFRQPWK